MHPVSIEDQLSRKPSCDINPGAINDVAVMDPEEVEGLTPAEAAKKAELYMSAKSIGVTVEKLIEMRQYAAKLRKKFPHMKEDRIKKKVAEYFKIKLV